MHLVDKVYQDSLPNWLTPYKKNESKVSCLFGEHLLSKYPHNPIALVEAPKTAIYSTLYFGTPEQLFPLRAELAKGVFQLSNHEKMVVSAVTNLSNLLTMWDKQDLMGKKLLAKTLYPSGIVVDRENILYRTQNQNVFMEYIQDITGNYRQTKKRNSELKFNYSALVSYL